MAFTDNKRETHIGDDGLPSPRVLVGLSDGVPDGHSCNDNSPRVI